MMPPHIKGMAAHPAQQPTLNPTVSYFVYLTLLDGTVCWSKPLDRLEEAEQVGKFSLLDRKVVSYALYRFTEYRP